jgi:hypothetical protein
VLAGDAWGLDNKPFDSWGDEFRVNDLEHVYPA